MVGSNKILRNDQTSERKKVISSERSVSHGKETLVFASKQANRIWVLFQSESMKVKHEMIVLILIMRELSRERLRVWIHLYHSEPTKVG